MTFGEKWLEAVEKKNSVLCAGLDPAEFEMGRFGKGLPEGALKGDWALDYIEAVAPYCAAVKPNFQYWKDIGDIRTLHEISKLAHSLDMVVIDDSKLADIGSTNDAGVYYGAQRADAVTFSPFAGNMEEAAKQAHDRGIGLISMVLMSNPEFAREKNKLVPLGDDREGYRDGDTFWLGTSKGPVYPFVHQYVQLAHDARKYGVDGVVIGAPSAKNHIQPEEIAIVKRYVGDDMLVLLPGVGAQGGEAGEIWKHFGGDEVIVNVGRSMMLPKGSYSKSDDQKEAAKHYGEMLNEKRAEAA